jgi:hypothetical protein
MLRTGESHDPKGRLSSRYGAGLSTDAGDQLPGSLATTRTGLTPAGDDGLTAGPQASPPHGPTSWAHSRILNNLKSVYAGRGDIGALSWVFDLRSALPHTSRLERREWAQVLGLTGRFLEAAELMEALVDQLPDHEASLVAEADAMRARLN